MRTQEISSSPLLFPPILIATCSGHSFRPPSINTILRERRLHSWPGPGSSSHPTPGLLGEAPSGILGKTPGILGKTPGILGDAPGDRVREAPKFGATGRTPSQYALAHQQDVVATSFNSSVVSSPPTTPPSGQGDGVARAATVSSPLVKRTSPRLPSKAFGSGLSTVS